MKFKFYKNQLKIFIKFGKCLLRSLNLEKMETNSPSAQDNVMKMLEDQIA